ncbi:hypothetical protein GW17_00040117 [Ensete ventricosum]|nr:hypothetical protein GW17_00040117 [Ensete ventricosum]
MIAHVFLGRKAETFAVQGRLPSSRDRATSVNGNAREPAGAVELGRRRRREARPKSVRRSPPVAALRHLRRDGFDSLGKFAPFSAVSSYLNDPSDADKDDKLASKLEIDAMPLLR